MRLANAETGIVWRNAANAADLALTVNASNQLTFNGTPIQPNTLTSAHILVGNGSNIATDVAMSGNVAIDNTGATTIQSNVITNSMVNSAAAIAITKMANGAANQLLGTNAGASANEWKTLSGTTSQITVTHGTGTITLATPQNIATGSSPTFAGLTLSSPLTVANGGTGDSSLTAYAVLCGGTTTTGAVQSVAAIGSSGQVLTSNGAGALPTFQDVAGTGTVGSGTAGRLTLYNASTTAVTDKYVQNTKNITIAIATQASRSADLAITIPNPGNAVTAANVVLDQGAYTIAGQLTLSSAPILSALSATTVPYLDASKVLTSSAVTPTELGYVSGVTSAIQTQLNAKAPIASPSFTGTGSFAGSLAVGTATPNKRLTVQDNSSSSTTAGTNPVVFVGGGNAANNTLSELGFSYGGSQGDTNAPVTIGYQLTSGSGNTKGDLTFCTRNVTTDAAPTERLRIHAAGDSVFSGNLSFATTSTQGIVGTTTNNSAAAGNVGETVSAAVAATNFPATTTIGDLTSISLTAGDWLVSASGSVTTAGTATTGMFIGISTTTGNSSTGLTDGDTEISVNIPASGSVGGMSLPFVRLSLSGSATAYFKYSATYTGTTPRAAGRITAVRIR